ncbi:MULTISPECIES: transposase family protein [unclassified Kitasatospora]|uniref:transposase family protein n=1 Tax=unclassified Kitasatospora TaxID=2633591 RepID=UPI0033C231C3
MNVAAIDAVCFADPKSSVIDIVQAVGRALRQSYRQGKVSWVIIPVYLPTPGMGDDTGGRGPGRGPRRRRGGEGGGRRRDRRSTCRAWGTAAAAGPPGSGARSAPDQGAPPPPRLHPRTRRACAVLAGAKSLTAIAEWAADAPAAVLTALGAPNREPSGPTAPAEATVRRILQCADGNALDAAIGAWLTARDADRPPPDQEPGRRARRSLAVDGKTVWGARRADGTQVHRHRPGCRPMGGAPRPTRLPSSSRCASGSTWPAPWPPSTRYADVGIL